MPAPVDARLAPLGARKGLGSIEVEPEAIAGPREDRWCVAWAGVEASTTLVWEGLGDEAAADVRKADDRALKLAPWHGETAWVPLVPVPGDGEADWAAGAAVRLVLRHEWKLPVYGVAVELRPGPSLLGLLRAADARRAAEGPGAAAGAMRLDVSLFMAETRVCVAQRSAELPLTMQGQSVRAGWPRFSLARTVTIMEMLRRGTIVARWKLSLLVPNPTAAPELPTSPGGTLLPMPSTAGEADLALNGMTNQGATCYMNSLLQCWYHLPAFRRAVYAVATDAENNEAAPEAEGDPADGEPGEATDLDVVTALQRVFFRLQTWPGDVTTAELTKAFGWKRHQAFEQQDVQELSRVLCDHLESVMGLAIERLFKGRVETYIECVNVEYASTKEEAFFDVQLDVKDCPTLLDSFRKYVEAELLEGDNKYDAEGHGKQDARKGVRFLELPPVLNIHLKRFQYCLRSGRMIKLHDAIAFPDRLDLSEVLEEAADAASNGARGAGGQPRKRPRQEELPGEAMDVTAGDPSCPRQSGGRSGSRSGSGSGSRGRPNGDVAHGPSEAAKGSDASSARRRKRPSRVYRLHSVLVHQGEVHGGHYYAFIRPMRSRDAVPGAPEGHLGQWYKFNDDVVTRADEEEVLAANFGRRAAPGPEVDEKEGPPSRGGRRERSGSLTSTPRASPTVQLNAHNASSASAYMLLYILEDALADVMTTGEAVVVPKGLSARFEEEEEAAEEKHACEEERSAQLSFRCVREADLVFADGSSVVRDWANVRSVSTIVTVRRENPCLALYQAIQDDLGVHFSRVRVWGVVKRQNSTVRIATAPLHLDDPEELVRPLQESSLFDSAAPSSGKNIIGGDGNCYLEILDPEGAHGAPPTQRLGPMTMDEIWAPRHVKDAIEVFRAVSGAAAGPPGARSRATPHLVFFRLYDPLQPVVPFPYLGSAALMPSRNGDAKGAFGGLLRGTALRMIQRIVATGRMGLYDVAAEGASSQQVAEEGLVVVHDGLRDERGDAWHLWELVNIRDSMEKMEDTCSVEDLDAFPGDIYVLERKYPDASSAHLWPRTAQEFVHRRFRRKFVHFLPRDAEAAGALSRAEPGLAGSTAAMDASDLGPGTTGGLNRLRSINLFDSDAQPAHCRDELGGLVLQLSDEDPVGRIFAALRALLRLSDEDHLRLRLWPGNTSFGYFFDLRHRHVDPAHLANPFLAGNPNLKGNVNAKKRETQVFDQVVLKKKAEMPEPAGIPCAIGLADLDPQRKGAGEEKTLGRLLRGAKTARASRDTLFFDFMPVTWRELDQDRVLEVSVTDVRLRRLVARHRKRTQMPGVEPGAAGARQVYVPEDVPGRVGDFEDVLVVHLRVPTLQHVTVAHLLDAISDQLGLAPREPRHGGRRRSALIEDSDSQTEEDADASENPHAPSGSRLKEDLAAAFRDARLRLYFVNGHRVNTEVMNLRRPPALVDEAMLSDLTPLSHRVVGRLHASKGGDRNHLLLQLEPAGWDEDFVVGRFGPEGVKWMPVQVLFFTQSGRNRSISPVGMPVAFPVTEANTAEEVLAKVRSHLGLTRSVTRHWKLAVVDSGSLRFQVCDANGSSDGGHLWQMLVQQYPPFEAGDGKHRARLLNTVATDSAQHEKCPMLGIRVEGADLTASNPSNASSYRAHAGIQIGRQKQR